MHAYEMHAHEVHVYVPLLSNPKSIFEDVSPGVRSRIKNETGFSGRDGTNVKF
jgi:hypothetical protein